MAKAKADHPDKSRRPVIVRPNRKAKKIYDNVYERYRALADEVAKESA